MQQIIKNHITDTIAIISFILFPSFFFVCSLTFLCYQTAFPCFHCHIQFAILFLQFYVNVCPAAWKRKQQQHPEKKKKKKNREKKKYFIWIRAKEKRWFKPGKSSLEYVYQANAYHQRNRNALILMENLYRNEIKCRMLAYGTNKWSRSPPMQGCSVLFLFPSKLLLWMQCYVLRWMMTHANSCFCLGRELIPFLPCTFNASLSPSLHLSCLLDFFLPMPSSRLCRYRR